MNSNEFEWILMNEWNYTNRIYFWQQQAVLRKTFTLPPPPKNVQHTFVLHTQNSVTFCTVYSKKRAKKQAQKRRQKWWQKSLFLNLSCCCLETGLKPVLFIPTKISSFIETWKIDMSREKRPTKCEQKYMLRL